MQIDKYDNELIKCLLSNSKESLTKLGKNIRLSRENTNYRIKRLTKEKLIKSFNAIINTKYLGYRQYAIFMQFLKVNKEEENKIIDFLKKQEFVSWIGILAGKWSITFDIYAKNDAEITKNINYILHLYGKNIKEYIIFPLEKKEYFQNKILGFEKLNYFPKRINIIKINDIDKKILEILNKNSRTTYAELSQTLNLTANAIKKRIKNLEKNNIIYGYSINIDPKILNFEWYGIQLKLLKFDEESIKKVESFFRIHKNVGFFYKYSSGVWNYDLGVFTKSQKELREFLIDLENDIGENIQINDFFFVIDEVTENSLPKIIFS